MHRTAISIIFMLTLLVTPSESTPAEDPNDLIIIANKRLAQDAITAEALKAIFLRKRRNWETGEKAIPINARDGTLLREAFQKRVLGLSPSQEQSYWEKQRVRKGLKAPAEITDPLRAVFKLKSSVGYVFRKNYKKGVVKPLLVVPAR